MNYNIYLQLLIKYKGDMTLASPEEIAEAKRHNIGQEKEAFRKAKEIYENAPQE